ncbi:heterokaryon incompatibility protein-domain-containing protein [Microdochium bolleyi]|uniref:Heterokaryon incompatibility protein-domain-containing protein n=1 Tax=Microdochium bolleyi TaxID=196109 RepID=A0A136IXF0_9PEZI|nr:heterokaryon incompatibility protein-domain-containing protein [Microdochium bolleyi]
MATPYQPLPQGGAHTRLLCLEPFSPSQDPDVELSIQASLRVVNLDGTDDNVDFTAISYTWEKSPSAAQICFPNGTSLPLTQNLVDLILVLQQQPHEHEQQRLTLWIDAVCINQQDVQERGSQVNIMCQIYSSARQVIAWLGRSTPASTAAFTFMQSVAPTSRARGDPDPWSTAPDAAVDRGLRDVLASLARPWFHRTWVIQEATLGCALQLMCGTHAIDWATFQDCVYAIWNSVPIWDLHDEADPEVRGLYSVTRTLQIRRWYGARGHVPLEVLLETAFFVEVTDQRDSIHGFRGICSDAMRALLPKPDYSVPVEPGGARYQRSVEHVFRETSATLLCHGSSLDVLALAGVSRPRPEGFPSWAIYIRHGEDVSAPFDSATPGRWDAGGPVETRPVLTTTRPGRIAVVGRVLDEITHVFAPFDVFGDLGAHRGLVTAVIDAWRSTRCSSREEHMDKLAFDLVLGLDPGESRLGPEAIDWFRDYLGWLDAQAAAAAAAAAAACGSGAGEGDGPAPTHDYHQHLTTMVGGWRVLITRTGLLGIAPPAVEEGDFAVIVPGCRLPLVIRDAERVETTGERLDTLPSESHERGGAYAGRTWTLVGWCYVRDAMRAEGSIDSLTPDIVLELA